MRESQNEGSYFVIAGFSGEEGMEGEEIGGKGGNELLTLRSGKRGVW